MNFKIENVEVENGIVIFDLVTENGRVKLAEHINYDEDGDFHSVESTDSNILCNLEDDMCSVFDMSEKPSLMPDSDWVPFYEIIEAVEEELEKMNLKKDGV